MRILLVSPSIDSHNVHPCLGLGYISSYMRARGCDTRIVDVGSLINGDLWTIAEAFDPDVVGVSIWCGGFKDGIEIAARFRSLYPQVIVVAGGPLGSYIPSELLADSAFDFVVCGPGEIACSELVGRIPRERAARRSWSESIPMSQRTIDGFDSAVSDLDTLPFPDRDPDSEYAFQNTLLTSRGCNARCIFCASRALLRCQCRSVENIVAEVEELQSKYAGQEFLFADDNFVIEEARTLALCARLGDMGIDWGCHTRADTSERAISAMASAGCGGFGVGVESGCPEVLRRIGKGISLTSVDDTAKVISSLGVRLSCYYMLGHYCDTVRTMQQTIDHARYMYETYNANVKFSFNTAYPGSPQYTHRESLGLTIHTDDWDEYKVDRPTVSGRGFSVGELQEAFFAASELMTVFTWSAAHLRKPTATGVRPAPVHVSDVV